MRDTALWEFAVRADLRSINKQNSVSGVPVLRERMTEPYPEAYRHGFMVCSSVAGNFFILLHSAHTHTHIVPVNKQN